jgi:hypothetical protein
MKVKLTDVTFSQYRNVRDVIAILSKIEIKEKDWEWHIGCFGDDVVYIQIQFDEIDNRTGQKGYRALCRKWVLDNTTVPHVVRTAWKAYQTAVLHEMQETFKYNGDAVYDPHILERT